MKADQLSIFLENRAGRLAEVTRILAEAGVNIRALSLADTSDFGILRLIVSDFEKAREKLKANGFTVGRTTVVAVKVDDRPGCTPSSRPCRRPTSTWSTCTPSCSRAGTTR
jgi:hypothetical protein